VRINGKNQAIVAATVAPRLQSACGGQDVGALTAVFRRHRQAVHAHLGALFPAFPIEGLFAVLLDEVLASSCLAKLMIGLRNASCSSLQEESKGLSAFCFNGNTVRPD
jgi:hypothetical protein